VLAGDLAPVFWVGLVLIGLLAPALLTLQLGPEKVERMTRLSSAQLGLLCVLVAGVAFRVLMFSLGSSVRHFFS
jgi:anaerobic dimethyl sulfoxide reductase subunit C (anchor subunit)